MSNVFNQTVTIVEDESGFNTETTFLFVIFAGIAVGLLLVGQHFLNKVGGFFNLVYYFISALNMLLNLEESL